MSVATLTGFYGKLPARGDFVRAGLPRRFTDPWDNWLQATLSASRARLGAAFLPAWLEAPVWRFGLAPGQCGPDGAWGVWMPSTDRVGRPFPLTLARIGPPEALDDGAASFLDSAQRAGLAAIAENSAPDQLAERLEAATRSGEANPQLPAYGTLWWTEGAPRVSARRFAWHGLPNAEEFPAMLDEPGR